MANTVLTSFDTWKNFLHDRVQAAENIGLSDDQINKLAYKIGDFLSNKIDPENPQERVLKDLWDVADQNDQKTIAKLMVKMVSDGQK
ncbi:DUF3243 domain-containing protein [Gorillibacterium sp. sgz5001074]|uniref:DUF3243 domain-containing protein n=1 Tax=Gorillibacterium sp. sgz5001074 TaxID=3446695 RepID=UPI003F667E8A